MNGDAREAVARAIETHTICMCGEGAENLTEQAQHIADYALAALAPIIAAEVRAWAEEAEPRAHFDSTYAMGMRDSLKLFNDDAETIASRICGDR